MTTRTEPGEQKRQAPIDFLDIAIRPRGPLDVLSRAEVSQLLDTSQTGLYHLYRNCSLAVLNSGSDSDDARQMMETYRDFDIQLLQEDRGVRLQLTSAPPNAFVDGKMLMGIREHLFSVLRDILYVDAYMKPHRETGMETTHAVFDILRNAGVLRSDIPPRLVVCWGGHSISRGEYEYTKDVGYQLGLRGLDICTGCGDGAMKGPMKGAAIGHAKQRIKTGRYLGISEPGIIAAEPPNPIINELVIMPDIEMRLEAFVRVGHAVIVFPGGAGTAEEILYILGLLMADENKELPYPLIFTGPESSRSYFEMIDAFLVTSLGDTVRSKYEIIIADPEAVAVAALRGIRRVRKFRKARDDAYYFNWLLHIPTALQLPFEPTHASMAQLDLSRNQSTSDLVFNLRRAFSGIVAGNIKEYGIAQIESKGPFKLHGDPALMSALDALLKAFIEQGRMRLPGQNYTPCYEVVS
jgi:predicted Rossmann-fold nucleotide-binding protein